MNTIKFEVKNWPVNRVPVDEIKNPATDIGQALTAFLKPCNKLGIEFGDVTFEIHGKTVTAPAESLLLAGR